MTTAMPISKFTPDLNQQQVFNLSWLASQAPVGSGSGPWDTKALQNAITSLKAPFSNWKVVWGPSYSLADLLTPNNAMFVAQQLDDKGNPLPVYVVAVAGTNASSLNDLLLEDLDIDPTNWKLAGGKDASQLQVTTGDMGGLKNLLGMQWPFNDIRTYLGSIQKPGVTLWFTGHSLGGALSPMLMLALMDPDSVLDTSKTKLSLWKEVNLLATAGPSIGNQAFLDYFRKVFSAGNARTTFVWNANDVVPHAWASASMQALTNPKNIYGLTFASGSKIATMISKQQASAAKHKYVQFAPIPAFECSLQPYTDSTKTGVAWTPDSEFVAQLGYQHLNAYVSQFGCDWFTLPNPCDNPQAAATAAKTLGGG